MDIKRIVKESYGKVATDGSCCRNTIDGAERAMGYTEDDIRSAPEGAKLGLGCGNPLALVEIKDGDTVLDLGSGAGFDCFLAAQRVGSGGKVIGIDMTPQMIELARENARRGGFRNVEFLLGDMEDLPLEDSSIDVVISNCAINLAVDKERVFKEVWRVLKEGGKFAVSDIVLGCNISEDLKESTSAYVGCISGALLKEDYLEKIKASGFEDVKVVLESPFYAVGTCCGEGSGGKAQIEEASSAAVSIAVLATKPKTSLG
ncbi:MAG: arsenite methyltransferase [Candidatus Caldarchaeum sp.]